MMQKLERPHAQALTHLIHAIRPTWDEQGIYAALGRARDMGNLAEVTIAAVKAAAAPDSRTPAVIATPGPHWRNPPDTTGAGEVRREPRCEIYGHEAHAARTCPACRTEWLTTRTWPNGTKHQDAIHAATDYDDARTRAANDREAS